jgi:hypothetical protein
MRCGYKCSKRVGRALKRCDAVAKLGVEALPGEFVDKLDESKPPLAPPIIN